MNEHHLSTHTLLFVLQEMIVAELVSAHDVHLDILWGMWSVGWC